MAEITLGQLEAKQRELLQLLEQMQNENDPRRIQALGNQLQHQGAELEDLAREFERQEVAKAGPPARGKIEVVLTPEQRARVLRETGVDLELVTIPDASGAMNLSMPRMPPSAIEQLALSEARNRQAGLKARTQTKAQIDDLLEEIEAKGGRTAQELVKKLRDDPNWIGRLK